MSRVLPSQPVVAWVCADPGIPVFGTKGASVHVQEIIRAWQARGARVEVFALRHGDGKGRPPAIPDDLADLPVHIVKVAKLAKDADPAQRERAQQEAAAQLAEQVVELGPDVVYERYSLFSTILQQVRAAGSAITVLEVNAPLIDEQRTHRVLVDEAGAQAALAAQVGAADVIACVSQPVADWVSSQLPEVMDEGVSANSAGRDISASPAVVVVPNGVNIERIQPVRPADEGDPVVVFVGTLKPWHGVQDLLRAAAHATRPWRIRLIGDGPMREELVAQAADLNLEVEMVGAVLPQEIPQALQGASVAVAPYPDSADHYFSPLKVYEYAAAGLPVVASAIGQLPQIVADRRTGLLVPPSDPAALAAAIDELVADPARAAAMGQAGRELMASAHSWHHVLDTTLAPLGIPAHTLQGVS